MNPSPRHPVQLAYCTDSKFLEPTLVSLYSLLKNTSAPVRAHIIGYQLTREDWHSARRLTALFPHARLETHDFDASLIDGIATQAKRLHLMTFARLFLHRYLSGRLLYLDGDTHVQGDVAPLFSVDMEGKLLAGVLSGTVSRFFHYRRYGSGVFGRREARKVKHRIKLLLERTGFKRVNNYINGGVLLFELDAIKNHPDLIARLEDVASASQMSMMDQDWLNMVFAGRIKRLPAEWNWYVWRRNKNAFPGRKEKQARRQPIIIHYNGQNKPWRDPVPLRKLLVHRLLRFNPKIFWDLEYQRIHQAFRRAMAQAEQQECAGERRKKEHKAR